MISPTYQQHKEEEDKQVFMLRTHPRISHLRKLYLMLAIQWTLAVVVTTIALRVEDFSDFLSENLVIYIIAILFLFLTLALAFFFRSAMSQFPLNALVYFLFTAALSLIFAYICVIDKSNTLLMILVGCWLITISLLVYVLTNKCEITYQGATLFIVAAIFIVLEGFLLYSSTRLVIIMLVSIAEVIWGFYLVYDTQTIVSGVKYDWIKDDYVSGAIGVYMDVIVLFLRLCELIKNLIVKERN